MATKHSKSIKRIVRKSTDTYCAGHDLEFPREDGCPACALLPVPRTNGETVPEPDEENVLDPDYVIDANKIDWITCPCGAVRVLPVTDDCPLCGRDTYEMHH